MLNDWSKIGPWSPAEILTKGQTVSDIQSNGYLLISLPNFVGGGRWC